MASGGRDRQFSLPTHPRVSGVDCGSERERVDGMAFNHGDGQGAIATPRTANNTNSPDPAILKLETEIEQHILKPATHSNARLPLRPAFGTKGTPITLLTNYMTLASNGTVIAYHYDVDFGRDLKTNRPIQGRERARFIQLLVAEHFLQHSPGIVSNFKSTVISNKPLNIDQQGYLVAFRTEEEDAPAVDAKRFRLHIQQKAAITVSDLVRYLTSTNVAGPLSSTHAILQTLNIIIGHNPKAASQITSVGSNSHFRKDLQGAETRDLTAGITAWRGYLLSVRAATGRLLVNVQVKHSPFYNEGPLQGLMQAFLKASSQNSHGLHQFLKGVCVNITHIARKNKAGQQIPSTKVIFGLAVQGDGKKLLHPPVVRKNGAGPQEVEIYLETTPTTSMIPPPSSTSGNTPRPTQTSAAGVYITLYDFFLQYYKMKLDPSLPVVNVGSQEHPMHLPAEVCQVIKGQPYKKNLSPQQTQHMIQFAVRPPQRNEQSIRMQGAHMLMLNQNLNRSHAAFNLSVDPSLIRVPGRILAPPKICYRNDREASLRDSKWNMRNVQFVESRPLTRWTWLIIATNDEAGPWQSEAAFQASRALKEFHAKLVEMGIRCAEPKQGFRITVNPRDLNNVDAEVGAVLQKFPISQAELVLVVLVTETPLVFRRVKYLCDVREGVSNVCVVAKRFAKESNHQYFANVALKLNLKLGGCNHKLAGRNQTAVEKKQKKLGIIELGNTMVVGLDVTHPSPASLPTAPSVVGIVASIDGHLAQWRAEIDIQERRKEMVLALAELIEGRLLKWKQHNEAKLPLNIIIYRDGVSEGQYQQVLEDELPRIQSACEKVYSAVKMAPPRLAIIIVGKRHNTRFYAPNPAAGGQVQNPKCGTVVDRGVTEARHWDFFMQAHTPLQGTARPAHYYVVYDDIFRGYQKHQESTADGSPFRSAADALEDLTHSMSYTFGRATTAVSICPPAYHADFVCDRARLYLSEFFDPSSTGSVSSGGRMRAPDSSMVRLHARTAETMFWI
ncbi:hypothetical protein A1O7_05258 [Cladophialophora yegresii CBS 114405]|uniref:Piwi domain-containing protein n=1 Tax=Cladophialophora yegresii CBS 114405 TaxID=1182544 RepID=W9W7Y6_9EURO|nr:uncharacterized protein A1O7_05258 [Cladophialophora yegresii CBS 114405]EXJ61105.1 hypothetical protein A1O7_05258 [Cladophialophora yegresii CBS 114405]